MARNFWVFAELSGSEFRKVAFELLGLARKLADKTGGDVTALAIGPIEESNTAKLGHTGADHIILCTDDVVKDYSTEAYATIIADLASEHKPLAIFFPATARGKDLAPKVAAKLGVGSASDCTGLEMTDNQRIIFTRPMYAGKIIAEVETSGDPQIATIRPNVFPYPTPNESRKADVERISADFGEDVIKTRILETIIGDAEVNLTEANIIVSGGRGMRNAENFQIIRELAKVLGAAVGASRAAVDEDFISQPHQVGQTGKTVSPNLYIACGISGAIQHRAGMSTSKCIVAINNNPDADIFKIADFGVVGDLFKIVPVLTEELRKEMG